MQTVLNPVLQSPEVALRSKLLQLERRLETLERLSSRVLVVTVDPNSGPIPGSQGQILLSNIGGAYSLWAHINGAWRQEALT